MFSSINGNKKTPIANIMTPPVKYIIATIFTCIGILGSVRLKTLNLISEPSLVILLLSSAALGLFIGYSERVKLLDLAKGQLVFTQIKASETAVKKLSLVIADYAEASRDGAYAGPTEDAATKVQKCIDEIRRIAG